MRMSDRFDDISRIVASPIPRRQALRRVIGALSGAALAPLSSAQAKPEEDPGDPLGCCCSNGGGDCFLVTRAVCALRVGSQGGTFTPHGERCEPPTVCYTP